MCQTKLGTAISPHFPRRTSPTLLIRYYPQYPTVCRGLPTVSNLSANPLLTNFEAVALVSRLLASPSIRSYRSVTEYTFPTTMETPFIHVASHYDTQQRLIVFIHPHNFPSENSPYFQQDLNDQLSIIPPNAPITLVYCHAALGFENVTLFSVRAFRAAYEKYIPHELRSRIQRIIPLHVSFAVRSFVYMSSFRMQHDEYTKIHYCDLIADLEKQLGVDATLLPFRMVDFDYDETMRCWVDRQHGGQAAGQSSTPVPDPSKSLLDMSSVSFSSLEEQLPRPEPAQSGASLEP